MKYSVKIERTCLITAEGEVANSSATYGACLGGRKQEEGTCNICMFKVQMTLDWMLMQLAVGG